MARRQSEHPPDRSSSIGSGLAPGGGQLSERVKGRGAATNPASRFETISLAQLPEGGGLDDLIHEEQPEPGTRTVPTRFFRDRSRTVINPVDSPDLHFKWTINPYRGCEHGCVYCYARPTHEYLGMSGGLDFETRIYCKVDAPELLRAELGRPSWRGEPIMLSGITDCYQPVERRMELTRRCLQVMAACGQPFSIVTKNALVTRDLDVLAPMAKVGAAKVAVSITTLDSRLASAMEPRASAPRERLRAVRELSEAGVEVAVMVAPVIPAVNDAEIPSILEAAAEAGAKAAGYVMLRLPWQNKGVFEHWLEREMPRRAARVESLIRGMRGGKLYDSSWGSRQRGEGPHAAQIGRTFEVFARRYNLVGRGTPLSSASFVKPEPPRAVPPRDENQLSLFGE
ncbi:MAG: PA0069 family radical SAM protein [Planctomycetota bacterium]|nr:PA0069 family radical SAM protein [Planctomycetota bacterium]